MPSDSQAEMLKLLEELKDRALAAGLLATFNGYGVLVLCLPEYGQKSEQLLLKSPAQSGAGVPEQAGSDRGKSGDRKG